MTMLGAPARPSPGRAPRSTPEERPRPHLRVVEHPRRRRRARMFTAIGMLVLFVVLFGAVSFHVYLLQSQQKIDRLTIQSQASQARYDHLRVTVDQLQSPARIVASARRLGMVEAADSTWLPPKGSADSSLTSIPANQSGLDDAHDYGEVKPYLEATP